MIFFRPLFAAILAVFLLPACSQPAPESETETAQDPPLDLLAESDLLIINGTVLDGTGKAPFGADVLVRDGLIAAVGEDLGPAREVIDAAGLIVAPGFIDVHTHSEVLPSRPEAENFPRMGVTTIVTGNCGSSRTDVAGFFGELEAAGSHVNVATLIGHNSVRREVTGGGLIRQPGPEQRDEMVRLVDRAMRDGALGLSTGLIYTPGTFAKTEEIVELARVAASHGGLYVSHMRHENHQIFEAVEELLHIAREADIPAQISHIKLSGPSAWGQSEKLLALLDGARAEGLEITHDQYAYPASSTSLSSLIPSEARSGSRDEFRARIEDPEQKAEIVREMKESLAARGSEDYAYAVISSYGAAPELNGLSIAEAAEQVRGSDSLEDQIDLILEIQASGGAGGVYHSMNEDDLRTFLRHPLTMVASDGGPRIFGAAMPHPRSYGNNARVLARYVREQKVLTVEEAVRKMTSLPAETFGLEGRGVLREGAIADLVLFDPESVTDPATFADPHHYAEGIPHVIVNGVPVVADGEMTGGRSGRAVRRGERK